MRSNIYILFGFLAGIAVVCIAVFTVILATSHAVSPSDFPVYAYSEYIDRTSSMTFTADGGAQLYEAEKAVLKTRKRSITCLRPARAQWAAWRKAP